MEIKIKSKYLIFPVNKFAIRKKLTFHHEGKPVYELNIRLDNLHPDYYAYIDVSRFMGQTISLSVSPKMEPLFREADEMDIPGLYKEPLRPQIHFTTKNGWINDPNGLIYLDGVYHMFYQHNPTEPDWENMHWGHAESHDLIHWEEKDIALFPDERGSMFSGSAVLDNRNLLGKNTEDSKAALLFYTTTNPFCQHMSYSTDNFQTITPYSNQPVVPHIEDANRDPKVVFCEELDCYIMALYLTNDIYCLLTSQNLTHWTELQRIQLKGDSECPDIFPLSDQDGNRKWVLMGASDKYLVGSFQNGKFMAEQPVLSLHYGDSGYAGQTFSNLPNGRVIRVVWDIWAMATHNFKGQMGIPMELSLIKHNETYYIHANPIQEIESIYNHTKNFDNITLNAQTAFHESLDIGPHILKIKGGHYTKGNLRITVFGKPILLDFSKNEITITHTAPISLTHTDLDLTIIVDTCSIEIFSNSGKIIMTCADTNSICDFNLPYVTLETDSTVTLDSVEIHSLDPIWNP